jgi:alkylhydroperoxidase family enzyme
LPVLNATITQMQRFGAGCVAEQAACPAKGAKTMGLIPYLPKDLAEPRELVAAIRARRGGSLLNLDRMLLHSPPLAEGWNGFLRAVRTELEVSPKLRELAICVVALLNHADYEYHHHAPEFLRSGGTATQVNALEALGRAGGLDIDLTAFDAEERAVLALAMEMTRNVEVSAATMAAVRAVLANDRQVVEIVGVIATYNMVSRFLVALGVEPE